MTPDPRLMTYCADCGQVIYRMTDDPDVIHLCVRCDVARQRRANDVAHRRAGQ